MQFTLKIQYTNIGHQESEGDKYTHNITILKTSEKYLKSECLFVSSVRFAQTSKGQNVVSHLQSNLKAPTSPSLGTVDTRFEYCSEKWLNSF